MSNFYRLQNMIRQEALKATGNKTFVSLGIISDYDPDRFLAVVQLYPAEDDGTEALQTGWLPIFMSWVGSGWGMFAPPSAGDLVEVHYQEGSLQNAYIALRSYSPNSPPVGGVPAGEFWLIHSTGSYFKLTNDGKLLLNGNVEIDLTAPTININVSGAANITAASVSIDSPQVELGNLSSSLTGLMNDVAISVFNNHVHSGVQTGSGDTGAPTTTLGPSALTTNVTAN